METKLLEKQSISAKFEVIVPAEDVDKSYERVIQSVARQVKIPGFRPGKAPKGIIVQKVGQDAINQEVRDYLVETTYPKAIKELELSPINAHFHAHEPNEGQDYSFEVLVDLYPEIQLPELSEIIIDTDKRLVSDDMFGEAVEQLRRDYATLVPVERAIEASDYVMVETLREGEEEGSRLPIDMERVSEDFAAQLIGKVMGDKVTLFLGDDEDDDDQDNNQDDNQDAEGDVNDKDIQDSENDSDDTPAEAGLEANQLDAEKDPLKLEVIIRDVKAKEKPTADDEFAKTLGFETWQLAEEGVRKNIQNQLDSETFGLQQEEFIDKLVAEAKLELPPSLVDRRKRWLLDELADELKKEQKITLETYLKNLEEKEGEKEKFEQDLQETAEARVRRDLVLERLLEQRGTKVSNEEFQAALHYMAMRQGQEVKRFSKEMGEAWLDNYRFLLTRDKAIRETLRELLGEDESAETETQQEIAGNSENLVETVESPVIASEEKGDAE